MFSLRDLSFVLCSRDLNVLRAQRIMGSFTLTTHKSKRSENHGGNRGLSPRFNLVVHVTRDVFLVSGFV